VFNSGALVAWLVAAAVPAFTLRNPLYLALILGSAWAVYAVLGRTSTVGSSWGGVVRIGLFFLLLAIPFNALSNHSGQIVLFRLPATWPIVGGPITLESVIAGAVNGLALFTILVVFAAFNAAVDHYQLLRATPAFLFEAGVVVSIAVTFVPQLVLSSREIREAQRIRGHRVAGVRGLLPLVLPLLATSLERAIQLAETMEARGFGAALRPIARRQAMWMQIGTLASLLGLLCGLLLAAYFPALGVAGWALAGGGVVGLAAVFWLEGRRVRRVRYRRAPWTRYDTAASLASLVALGAVLAARSLAPASLAYVPYPPGQLLPPFNPWVGASLLLLLVPALLALNAPAHRESLLSPPPTGEVTRAHTTEHDHDPI
jgi:energy-coupling factor transport system permease protein